MHWPLLIYQDASFHPSGGNSSDRNIDKYPRPQAKSMIRNFSPSFSSVLKTRRSMASINGAASMNSFKTRSL